VDHPLERVLALEGTLNTRDLGGYPTSYGYETAWRRVLRSDSLHRLTANDHKTLHDLNLKAVIDLRRTDEVQADPNRLGDLDVVYYNLPIFPRAVSSVEADNPLGKVNSLTDVYKAMLDYFQESLLTVFETLAAYAGETVIIHCSAGKDRTGVVSALLLDLAGVARETIIADYAITKQRLAPMLDSLRARALTAGFDMARHEQMLLCEPEMMADTLTHLYDRYGGAASYLATIGLNAAQVEALRYGLQP
jgi:protein-tyrosine phosphatase